MVSKPMRINYHRRWMASHFHLLGHFGKLLLYWKRLQWMKNISPIVFLRKAEQIAVQDHLYVKYMLHK